MLDFPLATYHLGFVLLDALNHALVEKKIANANPEWKLVKRFKDIHKARVVFLTDDEARRLVDACEDFRALVTAALLTGIRYGDLTRLTIEAFLPGTATLRFQSRKAHKTVLLALGDEAIAFLHQQCAGKCKDQPILPRADGHQWGQSEQQKRMADARKAAGLPPTVSFHGLRHTYASRLVSKGVPFAVVAAQLGHASIKEVEHHYAHFQPRFVADTIKGASPAIGLLGDRAPKS